MGDFQLTKRENVVIYKQTFPFGTLLPQRFSAPAAEN